MGLNVGSICLATALVLILNGCAMGQPDNARIANQFQGTWTNIIPSYQNWWEFKGSEVLTYGTALDNGRCGAYKVAILNSEKIDIRVGNSATVDLLIDDGKLIFIENGSVAAIHRRVLKTDVCRRADGTYFDGAPYIDAGR